MSKITWAQLQPIPNLRDGQLVDVITNKPVEDLVQYSRRCVDEALADAVIEVEGRTAIKEPTEELTMLVVTLCAEVERLRQADAVQEAARLTFALANEFNGRDRQAIDALGHRIAGLMK